ncbi:hypothetical protein GALL_506560 [mine drainage metagenome]|uniref:Uncharacterized protein n=1 Tax=mine drainage metagenome TaxID=410659 RepID=A0A1J5PR55_9ZZZZ
MGDFLVNLGRQSLIDNVAGMFEVDDIVEDNDRATLVLFSDIAPHAG